MKNVATFLWAFNTGLATWAALGCFALDAPIMGVALLLVALWSAVVMVYNIRRT